MVDYKQTWDLQEQLLQEIVEVKVQNRKQDKPVATHNYLLFCQHPHVYTLGKSGNPENLLLNNADLAKVNAQYYPINRGGDITYHGPGQIVGYPILDLENFFMDIHKYLRYLEEAVIKTCAHYQLDAGRIEGYTGVWLDYNSTNPRKICAIGVKTSRWVTMHGFAFNVNTDLNYFNHIVPCGIDDKAVTSLAQELGHELDFNAVADLLKNHLSQEFGMTLEA